MTWFRRLDELGRHQATEFDWPAVWALVVRGERTKGQDWTRDALWTLREASFLLRLDAEAGTCRNCGGKIDDDKRDKARYHSVACRKAAFRARQAGELTAFEVEVERARTLLADLRHEVELAQRALRRLSSGTHVAPPDWSRWDHVPNLPDRCEGLCSGPCLHTAGGACLFSATPAPHPREDLEP